MRKFCILFFILLFQGTLSETFAQSESSYRFTYQFTFQRDTADVNSKVKEPFVLDVFNNHSSFVSLNKIRNDKYLDSLTKSIENAGGVGAITSINIVKPAGAASESVIYKFPDGKIRYQDKVSGVRYEHKEDMNLLDWEILDSSTTYSNYTCQLAKTYYGGREWFAWFTTEIPVPNGPYKFMGLPGLIVKMEDAKGECLYELTEVARNVEANPAISKAESVSKKEMRKIIENARNKSLSATIGGLAAGTNMSTTMVVRDASGRQVSMEELEKQRQERMRKNNNRIEID
ncbi:MAG: GLPGLI family protein [Chitinophagaceae bacterium]|nr:GLPGLI family protein [Chitinophagaceae bacterium]